MLAGCVLYNAGEIPFFRKKTVIQTEKSYNIGYEHFDRSAKMHEFRVEGKMPDGFHKRLVTAITNSTVLNAKEQAKLLEAIGEEPAQ